MPNASFSLPSSRPPSWVRSCLHVAAARALRKLHAGRARQASLRRRPSALASRAGYTAKPIERIAVGDRVWAWDAAHGSLVQCLVSRLFRHPDKPVLQLVFHADDDARHTIEATVEHPFWVLEKGWVPARQLVAGDVLRGIRGGGALRIESVLDTGRRADVYNFEVHGLHNYFVGGPGVLVHNMSDMPPFDIGGISEKQLRHIVWEEVRASQGVYDPRSPEGRALLREKIDERVTATRRQATTLFELPKARPVVQLDTPGRGLLAPASQAAGVAGGIDLPQWHDVVGERQRLFPGTDHVILLYGDPPEMHEAANFLYWDMKPGYIKAVAHGYNEAADDPALRGSVAWFSREEVLNSLSTTALELRLRGTLPTRTEMVLCFGNQDLVADIARSTQTLAVSYSDRVTVNSIGQVVRYQGQESVGEPGGTLARKVVALPVLQPTKDMTISHGPTPRGERMGALIEAANAGVPWNVIVNDFPRVLVPRWPAILDPDDNIPVYWDE